MADNVQSMRGFPTRAEAGSNLRSAFGVFRARTWVLFSVVLVALAIGQDSTHGSLRSIRIGAAIVLIVVIRWHDQ